MDDNLSGYWRDNSVECGIKNAKLCSVVVYLHIQEQWNLS